MDLLPDNLRRQLPALYSQSNLKTEDKLIHLKYIFPMGRWTWYVIEGSPQDDDFLFYGFVIGLSEEWRYFTLSQLEQIDVCGVRVERDDTFTPVPFSKIANPS